MEQLSDYELLALISPLIQLVACAGSIVFAFYQAGNAHQATDT